LSGSPSPSLSAVSVESGMPFLLQSGGGGVAEPGPVPGPVTGDAAPGSTIGDFDTGVFLLKLPDSTEIWKQVGAAAPLTIERNVVPTAGTTTSIWRVLFALDGRARTSCGPTHA
jgi:hypothetical protein